MIRFEGKSEGDYARLQCLKCRGDVHVTFLGYDPAVPRFRFECRGSCGAEGEYKMQWQLWSGLPQKATRPPRRPRS